MSDVKSWIENSGFSRTLGIRIDETTEDSATLSLDYKKELANPGALHGGVYATLSLASAHACARSVLGAEVGPFHTAGFQINYLAAAIKEGVTAKAIMLRRGKELCFLDVAVHSESGVQVSQTNIMIRGRQGAAPAPALMATGDDGNEDRGDMWHLVTNTVPFIKARGITVDLMARGRSRLYMPWDDNHSDSETGGTHEGAALALLDTAGAMAAWSVTGVGPYKASTPALQAQVLAAPPREDLVAYAVVTHQDNELFLSDVEVAGMASGEVCARGTVLYRIKT